MHTNQPSNNILIEGGGEEMIIITLPGKSSSWSSGEREN